MYPDGFQALVFLERMGDDWDCPSDIVLYAKTTTTGGFVGSIGNTRDSYTHRSDECKTTGVSYLDGYDIRTLQKLESVKIAYTVQLADPPHGFAYVAAGEMCPKGEYGVYVGVRP